MDRAGSQPESVLYLAPDGMDAGWLRDQWCEHGTGLQFAVRSLDDVVDQVYDRSVTASGSTYFTREHHRQVVDTALHALASDHRFAPGDVTMSNGHLREIDDLLTLTEFAGLHTAEEIADRLADEALPDLATNLASLKAEFDVARASFADGVERSLRSERYARVVAEDSSDYLSYVDVVVVGQFSRLSPVEIGVLEWLTEAVPTYAIVPRFTEGAPAGIDRTLRHLWETYTTGLDLTPHAVHDDAETATAIDEAAFRRFYQPVPEERVSVGGELDLVAPMDVAHEARHVMRRVQSVLTEDDVEPADVGVVVTDESAYVEHLAAAASDRGVPVRVSRERDLDGTRPGAAFFDLLDLLAEPADDSALAAFLSSPCTELAGFETAIRASDLGEALEAADDSVESAALEDEAAAIVEDVRARARAVSSGSIDDLREFASAFGLEAPDAESVTPLEAAAWETIERTIEVVTQRPTVESRPDWVPALRRAFGNATVSTTRGSVDESVQITGVLGDSERTYDHVFVVGLTQSHYPSGGRRLAFTRRLNEAHADFDRSNPDQRADHRLATLVANAHTATLSRPRTREDGSEYVDAGFLQELRNHTAVDATPIDEYGHLSSDDDRVERIGSSGDAWRALGVIGGAGRDALEDALDATEDVLAAYLNAADADSRSETVANGVATASARATSEPGPRNGWLDPDTVAGIDAALDGSISPSELETYAQCGFKHKASYLLDLESDDDDTTSADRGTVVHDILDRFYSTLQTAAGDPVDVSLRDRDVLESHLFEVAESVLSEVDDDADDVVTDSWERDLLAGLAGPDVNPQYNPWDLQEPVTGTLAAFVEEECTLQGTTEESGDPLTTRPAYFERYLRATVDGVDLHGKVDRVDVDADGEFVVRDYKTGWTPREGDVLDGLAFQLPVYLHLAAVETDHDPIGGTYYQIAGPNDVSSFATVLASGEDAGWHAHGGSALRRFSHPRFDTRTQFETFLDEVVPDRISRIVDGVEQGYFHPAVNDPDDAGCSYCEYSEICDVRSDRRRTFVEAIDERSDADVYVPLAARGEEYDPATDAPGEAPGAGADGPDGGDA
ncbi:hypothetical protein G9C85_15165 [Halorubellus sp. JP-L1]|uniref:PD-(D/E)XK nuclease family protein n=1 Tax=Halorubellus sp. JP-L1 TaxID=2715753 RepID=UPI00140D2D0B|nr:PD-(D/E)XK nuclease family protein [Halorubellus sp. JP-L1]NHN42959.1 hypothetical protein [Halorubellus sp. JP-L1]